MKELAAFLLVLGAVFGAQTLEIGELCDNVPLLRHPTDCNSYFECRTDRFALRHCPGTLHFNDVLHQCDHPSNANCTVVLTNPCDGNSAFLPHPDCEMFYSCALYVPREGICSNGLHWSADEEICTSADKAGCVHGAAPFQPDAIPIAESTTLAPATPAGPNTTTELPTDPTTIPPNNSTSTPRPTETTPDLPTSTATPILSCKSNFDLLPHSDCSMFYSCVGRVPREMKCPVGRHWSINRKRCVSPSRAQCVEGSAPLQPDAIPFNSTTTPRPTRSTTPSSNSTATPRPTRFTTPSSNSTSTPRPTRSTTPSGNSTATPRPTRSTTLSSNSTATPRPTRSTTPSSNSSVTPRPTRSTTPSSNSTATPRPTRPTTPSSNSTATPRPTDLPTSTETPIRHCQSNFDFLPHPDCSMFYSCSGGVPRERSCPGRLHFSSYFKICVSQSIAKCVEGSAPFQPDAIPISSTTPRPTRSTTPSSNSTATPRPTRPTTPSSNSTTTSRPTTDLPTTTETPIRSCQSNLDFLPHPDCSMFYSCSGGVPRERSCPGRLHFSSFLKICVSQSIAKCVEGSAPFQPDATPISSTTPRPTRSTTPSSNSTATPRPTRPTTPSSNSTTTSRPTTDLPTTTETPIKSCQSNLDFLPHPDCSMFYSCSGGVPRERSCPGRLHFSSYLKICVSPSIAKCVEGSAPFQPDAIPISSTTPRPTRSTTPSSNSTATPRPTRPTTPSSNSTTTPRPTTDLPTSTTPNATTSDPPTRPTTHPTPTTEETTTTSDLLTPSLPETTIQPTPPTPNLTTTTSQPTPPTPEITTSTTVQQTTEAFTEPTTEKPRNDCADHYNSPYDVLLPHPTCTLFYQCVWGLPVVRPCPPGLHFNAEVSVCDFPAQANCVPGGAPEQRDDI